MKNVLFATTALVAFAGAAAADVGWSGQVDMGYNDALMGGLYTDGTFTLNGSVDLGDNVTASITWGAKFEYNNDANDANVGGAFDLGTGDGGTKVGADDDGVSWNTFPTATIATTGGVVDASISFGPVAVASSAFYKSRTGMTTGLEAANADDIDVLATIGFGSVEAAAGCNGIGDGVCDGMNYGIGATFGAFTIGAGYDDAANGATAYGVSVDATFGAMTVGASLAGATSVESTYQVDGNDADYYTTDTAGVDTPKVTTGSYTAASYGLSVAYDISAAFAVNGYYSANANDWTGTRANSFGLGATYTSGAFAVAAYYNNNASLGWSGNGVDVDGDGDDTGAGTFGYTNTTKFGADVTYDVNEDLAVLAGVQSSVATGNAPVAQAMNYYAGVTYAVNENVSATMSYATTKAISGPKFMDGISVFLSASF